MAVPFYIPDEDEASSSTSGEASAASSQPSSPSRPIPIPLRSAPQSPQSSPIDNEVLVQAFYEALCRCSQAGSPMSPPMSPSSPFNQGQFFFSHMTPSTSAFSSPRHSFRVPRRRLDSQGSYAQETDAEEEEEIQPQPWNDLDNHYTSREQLEEFSGRVPQPKNRKSNHKSTEKPKTKSESAQKGKITNFVISALQYVIDTLR